MSTGHTPAVPPESPRSAPEPCSSAGTLLVGIPCRGGHPPNLRRGTSVLAEVEAESRSTHTSCHDVSVLEGGLQTRNYASVRCTSTSALT
jgi:hypothetical protein